MLDLKIIMLDQIASIESFFLQKNNIPDKFGYLIIHVDYLDKIIYDKLNNYLYYSIFYPRLARGFRNFPEKKNAGRCAPGVFQYNLYLSRRLSAIIAMNSELPANLLVKKITEMKMNRLLNMFM